jgi:hypothetical protein
VRLLASALLAIMLLAGCGGYSTGSGSGSATTVATEESRPPPDPDLQRRITSFNDMLRQTKPDWRFSAKETVRRFVGGDTANQAIIEEHGDTASATATSAGLEDDSVQQERYGLELVKSATDGWMIKSGVRTFKCQQNRGHQDFSPELCL